MDGQASELEMGSLKTHCGSDNTILNIDCIRMTFQVFVIIKQHCLIATLQAVARASSSKRQGSNCFPQDWLGITSKSDTRPPVQRSQPPKINWAVSCTLLYVHMFGGNTLTENQMLWLSCEPGKTLMSKLPHTWLLRLWQAPSHCSHRHPCFPKGQKWTSKICPGKTERKVELT